MTLPWDYDDTAELRIDMVQRQLQARGISRQDILVALNEIPRHMFIPEFSPSEAYSDRPLPIKAGQTISQPYIVALMIQYLETDKSHNILELGSGSGYATAILSKLCQHVDAMEVYDILVQDSRRVLAELAIHNVTIQHRSAWEQLDKKKVYERIILWASPPRIPQHLFDNLSDEGILVSP